MSTAGSGVDEEAVNAEAANVIEKTAAQRIFMTEPLKPDA
jgi:hypothetical protein